MQLIWALDVGRATRGALAATIANLHKMMGSHNHPTELIWHFIVSKLGVAWELAVQGALPAAAQHLATGIAAALLDFPAGHALLCGIPASN